MRRKLLIDVDTGVDDAQALILAFSQPDVDVLAVTCVNGNVDLDKVCKNTLRVLKVCGKMEVPVYRGSDKPILEHQMKTENYHGLDGLGCVSALAEVDTDTIQSEHAVLAMLRLVNQHPGEITLVALAPLTNIALAIRLDPDFGRKLKQFTVMGGNIEGRGNVTVAAEFNFCIDPEAAAIVLSDLNCDINLLSWETSIQHGQPWDWTDTWLSANTDKGKFIHQVTQMIVHTQRDVNKKSIFVSCDLFAMATVIDPELVIDTENVHALVELHGQLTRGQMVIDWRGRLGRKPNVNIIKKIDMAKARTLFDAMML